MTSRQFADLYDQHSGLLYYWVLGQVRNKEQAEDIIGKAWMKAWANRSAQQTIGKAKAWLYQIAGNEVKAWARHESCITWEAPEECHDRPDPQDFTLDLEKRQELSQASRAIQTLKERQKKALAVHCEGLSVMQSAKKCSASVGTYASRVFYAQKKVRQLCGV
jgi:RNA polymerase sigma factor (sigma-70 family)